MTTTARLRRLALAALAATGVATAAAPAAHADTLWVKTEVSVPAPYDASKLLPDGQTILERGGPVAIKVRHRIVCQKGTVRRSGMPATCQWSSALYGAPGGATIGTASGQGDVYALGTPTYPTLGTTFHAATLREGYAAYDDWTLIVRDDQIRESMEVFNMSVKATGGGAIVRSFTIADDDWQQ